MIYKKDVIEIMDAMLERTKNTREGEVIEAVVGVLKNKVNNIPEYLRIEDIERLMSCFSQGLIVSELEFVPIHNANVFMDLKRYKNEIDLKAGVLESFSRAAIKSQPFDSDKKNKKFNDYMLKCICEYLDQLFTRKDMELIYTKLGGGIRPDLARRFVLSGYDMSLLEG